MEYTLLAPITLEQQVPDGADHHPTIQYTINPLEQQHHHDSASYTPFTFSENHYLDFSNNHSYLKEMMDSNGMMPTALFGGEMFIPSSFVHPPVPKPEDHNSNHISSSSSSVNSSSEQRQPPAISVSIKTSNTPSSENVSPNPNRSPQKRSIEFSAAINIDNTDNSNNNSKNDDDSAATTTTTSSSTATVNKKGKLVDAQGNELTPEEKKMAGKARRLAKNRESARRFRQRQRDHINTLEHQAEQLTLANAEIGSKLQLLSAENKILTEQLTHLRTFLKKEMNLWNVVQGQMNNSTPLPPTISNINNTISLSQGSANTPSSSVGITPSTTPQKSLEEPASMALSSISASSSSSSTPAHNYTPTISININQ